MGSCLSTSVLQLGPNAKCDSKVGTVDGMRIGHDRVMVVLVVVIVVEGRCRSNHKNVS